MLLQVPWPLHDCPLQKLQDVPVLHDWVAAGLMPVHRLSPTCSSAHTHLIKGKQVNNGCQQVKNGNSRAGQAAFIGFLEANMCTHTGWRARMNGCWAGHPESYKGFGGTTGACSEGMLRI